MYKFSSLLLAALLLSLFSFAQPANDNPCDATELVPVYTADLTCNPVSGGFSYTGATASYMPGPSFMGSNVLYDVWFKFTAQASGRVAVRFNSSSDGVLVIYKAGCSSLYASTAPLTQNDDTLSSLNPFCLFDVSQGEEYLIRYGVYVYSSATVTGICLVTDAPPANSSQRVGIGISNPHANLDVNGTIQIRGGSPADGSVLTSNGQGLASWKKVNNGITAPLTLSTDVFAAAALTANHTGSESGEGIRASTGATSAHYGSSAAIVASSKDRAALSVHSDDFYAAEITSYNHNFPTLYVTNADTTTSDPEAAIFSGSVKIRMPGNAGGIWSGSNSGNLYVEGGVGINAIANTATKLQLDNSDGNKISLSGYAVYGAHVGLGVRSGNLQLYTANSSGNLLIGYGNSASFTELMRLTGAGRLGLGTSNPGRKLEVISSGANVISIGSTSAFGAAGVEFLSDYGLATQWRPGFIQSGDIGGFTGKLEFYTNGTGSGNLYGTVKGFEVRNGAALTATGSVGSYSDARLKEQIIPFSDGLNIIKQINPVRFRYNQFAPFPTDEQQIGILAQELERVAPYMVRQTQENGFADLRWVNNQAYTFLLINAVKEQQSQLDATREELNVLKLELKELRERIRNNP